MHFANALLHFEADLDLLVLGELDYGDPHAFLLVAAGEVLHWLHGSYLVLLILELVEHGSDVQRGHFHHFLSSVLGLEQEVCLAHLAVFHALLRAGALPGVLEVIHCVAHEGDQADPLAQKLVMQNGGVFHDADQVGRQGGHFRDHDTAEGVGQTDVAAGEGEPDALLTDIQDLNRHFLHLNQLQSIFKVEKSHGFQISAQELSTNMSITRSRRASIRFWDDYTYKEISKELILVLWE